MHPHTAHRCVGGGCIDGVEVFASRDDAPSSTSTAFAVAVERCVRASVYSGTADGSITRLRKRP